MFKIIDLYLISSSYFSFSPKEKYQKKTRRCLFVRALHLWKATVSVIIPLARNASSRCPLSTAFHFRRTKGDTLSKISNFFNDHGS
jgi:hypothetical protein